MTVIEKIRYFHYRINVKYNEIKIRRRAVSIGEKCRINGHLGCDVKGKLIIGYNFSCSSGNMLNPMGVNHCSYFRVNEGAELSIGNNVGLSCSTIWVAEKIRIDDYVKIGAMCIISDTDAHSLDPQLRQNPATDSFNAKTKPIEIKENAFIGARSIICKGVTIGRNAIVGIGSVVTKSIPDNEIWAGNPAHFISKIQ